MTPDDSALGSSIDDDYPLATLVRRYGLADAHHLVVHTLFVATKSFIGFADVFVIGLAIDALFADQPLVRPLVPEALIPTEPIPLLLFAAGVVAAINIVTILLSAVSGVSEAIFTQRLLHRIRLATFDAAQNRGLDYYADHRTGDVMSTLNDDVNQLQTFFAVLLGAFVWIVVTLVAAVVYMGVLNWQLALFVLAAAPLVAAVNYWYSRRLDPLQATVRDQRGTLNAHLETGLDAVDTVKAYTAEDAERDRVEDASLDHFRARFDAKRRAVQQAPINRLIVGAWLVATVGIGVTWVLDGPPLFFTGTLTVGQLVPFLFYLERLTHPLKNLSGVIDGYHSANASARRILDLADTQEPEELPEGSTMEDAPLQNNAPDRFDGDVQFDAVTFSYPGTEAPAIQDVSFEVDAGETIGIVGATGAGKSTLVKLLLRLADPDAGTITLDGRDTREFPPRELRQAIGYVNQDAFLFNGTVRYNIAYGAEGECADDIVHAAARLAGVHDDIMALPDGYDTEVGDRGVRLSGGQRQRIAIARAIVDNPPILVLDEATSHVDNETERIIQRQLDALTENRTTFVVAHRLSTVRNADRILVLEGGEIVERGTHDELVDAAGAYATLWNIQVGWAESAAAD